jgi:glycosyltransferase involved in cell wall biosynthesis
LNRSPPIDRTPMPQVSVIIPVFNAAATVAETIESVLRQTFEDYEIIVVDDGSTDRTSQVLGRYQDRIQMIRRPNGGISVARNSGVAVSRGEYLAFLDGDDLWVPDFLNRTVAELEADRGCVMAFTDLVIVDSEGRELKTSLVGDRVERAPTLEDLFARLWPIMPSAVLMRRSAFTESGGFSEEFRSYGYEDVYMWMRARELGTFAYVSERLVVWRFSLFPKPLKRGRKEREAARLFERLARERWNIDVNGLIRARERAPRTILGYIGLKALDEGDRATAREAFARALRFDPLRARNYLRYARTYLPLRMARALGGRTSHASKQAE